MDGVRLGVDHGHMRLESGANARLCTRMHASSQLIIHSSPSHAPRDAFCPPLSAFARFANGDNSVRRRRFGVECRPGQLGDHARTEMRTTQDARGTRHALGRAEAAIDSTATPYLSRRQATLFAQLRFRRPGAASRPTPRTACAVFLSANALLRTTSALCSA